MLYTFLLLHLIADFNWVVQWINFTPTHSLDCGLNWFNFYGEPLLFLVPVDGEGEAEVDVRRVRDHFAVAAVHLQAPEGTKTEKDMDGLDSNGSNWLL